MPLCLCPGTGKPRFITITKIPCSLVVEEAYSMPTILMPATRQNHEHPHKLFPYDPSCYFPCLSEIFHKFFITWNTCAQSYKNLYSYIKPEVFPHTVKICYELHILKVWIVLCTYMA
jgi:hypothetical protein